jgi:transposase
MTYKVAGIDIHKSMLIVVVAAIAAEAEDAAAEALEFDCRRFGAGHAERIHLVNWLQQRGVTEVVMESTAQYWKPVWLDLEPHFPKLHLAQAQSNRAPKGRKNDFRDAKRLARRLLAGELILSYVPDAEQRTWRTLTRGKLQLVRDRVRLQNRLEALLEEMRIKLSGVISDLLGVSGRRILGALSKGETDPARLADLGDKRLQCSREELTDALHGAPSDTQLEVLKLSMEHLRVLDEQILAFDKLTAKALKSHEAAVLRVAQVPGFGPNSAQQIIAEMGVDAATFPSAGEFSYGSGSARERTSARKRIKARAHPKAIALCAGF